MKITFSLSLPRDSSTVPVVRRTCRESLGILGVSSVCVEEIELAVSEACSNVLKHVEGTGAEYEVKVAIDPTSCEILISDTGAGFDYQHDDRPEPLPSLTGEGGRGLFLMRAMVDVLEFHTEPRKGTSVHLVKKLAFASDSPLYEMGLSVGS